MIRLECDYAEGAHERVLRRLFETNLEQTPGYGEDLYCARAREYIQQLCQREGIDVHFLVGGTQTNTTVIAAALRPHQGVIAATSGHINVHETGAIEATGHKVLAVPSADGKLTGREVRRVYESHWQDATREHMVQPGMVYLSQPTENGTLYSLAELTDLWETCQDCGLFLFVDGARLGYGLMSEACDMTLPDLARRCDGFSIGGTKQGLLFGEALVLSHPALRRDFRYHIKQHGGLLAKGWLLGLQFEVLMDEGRYLACGAHGTRLGQRLKTGLAALGYEIWADSPTNQILVILDDAALKKLEGNASYSVWQPLPDGRTVVRFATSWATAETEVDALIALLK